MSAVKHELTREIYVRHTSETGHSYVASHVVWDARRFIESLEAAANKLNRDGAPVGRGLAHVEQITEAQYLKEKTK